MCYAKPGPRCSAHMKTAMSAAQVAAQANPSEDNLKALKDATDNWQRTPDGIKDLRHHGEDQLAACYQEEREAQITAYQNDQPTTIGADGSKFWEDENGEHHRGGDKPAIEWTDGRKDWYVNGKQHRDGDKPAVEQPDGTKAWYLNGEYGREGDKPAVEYADGSKAWYVNGKLHREGDKPAGEYANGTKVWSVNGERHREDGKPAIEYADGTKEWWVNGIQQPDPVNY